MFELLYSTRDGVEFDRRSASLGTLPVAPVVPSVLVAARDAFRELAHRRPLFHRSVTMPDLIVAAAAAVFVTSRCICYLLHAEESRHGPYPSADPAPV